MVTQEQKKEFALSQLAPYLANPSTCGVDENSESCLYLTPDGRMCVAGKNMITPKDYGIASILTLLENNHQEQEGLFKPEVVGILTNKEWSLMQRIHDSIAIHTDNVDRLKDRITLLNLFTYEELVERAETLK